MLTENILMDQPNYEYKQINDWLATLTVKSDNGYTLTQNSDFPIWIRAAVNKLVEFMYLKENWDSYGAKSIDRNSIEFCVELMLSVMGTKTPKPSIVPNPSGYVQLEWHAKGIDLEIEIISTTHVYVDYEDAQIENSNWDGDLTVDFSRLRGYMRTLTDREA